MQVPLPDPVNQAPRRALAFVHNVPGLIPVFDALATQHLPLWQSFAMLDESLLQATIRQGRLS